MKNDNDILTIEEAAEYLQMNVTTIRRMLKGKEIPARMVRNKWRFSRPQLREWVEQRTMSEPDCDRCEEIREGNMKCLVRALAGDCKHWSKQCAENAAKRSKDGDDNAK